MCLGVGKWKWHQAQYINSFILHKQCYPYFVSENTKLNVIRVIYTLSFTLIRIINKSHNKNQTTKLKMCKRLKPPNLQHTGWPWVEHRWWLTLACSPGEAPKPVHPMHSFRPHKSTTQPPKQATHSRGRLSGHQYPTKVSPALWVGSCPADPPQWSQLVLTANWPRGKFLPLIRQ